MADMLRMGWRHNRISVNEGLARFIWQHQAYFVVSLALPSELGFYKFAKISNCDVSNWYRKCDYV